MPVQILERALVVCLTDRYLSGLLDPFVTSLEVQKLMYFMQASGQHLRLSYKRGPCGPYASNLRHVLNEVEGHFVSGFAHGEEAPAKMLNLVLSAREDALAFLHGQPETMQRFDRVANLIDGFESSYGLELLATVHWLATRERITETRSLIEAAHNWNERKERFTPRQIQIAADVLADGGWIAPVSGREEAYD